MAPIQLQNHQFSFAKVTQLPLDGAFPLAFGSSVNLGSELASYGLFVPIKTSCSYWNNG